MTRAEIDGFAEQLTDDLEGRSADALARVPDALLGILLVAAFVKTRSSDSGAPPWPKP